MRFLRSRFVMFAALLVVLGVAPAYSQDARLGGVVRDTTGAAVPGATVTITNQATGATPDRDLRRRRQLLRHRAPRRLHGRGRRSAASAGRPAGDVELGASGAGRRVRARAAGARRRSRSRPCCASRALADVPFSVAAPTEDELRQRGVDDIEGVAANVAGFTRAEPRPRPEPGRHARRLRRPDRARPAGRQGAGRRLPRRLGHLALAVHAGHRPVRRRRASRCCAGRRARCSAPARSRAPCATSPTSPSSASRKWFGEVGAQHDRRRQPGRQRQARRQRARSATRPRCAWPRYYNRIAGYIDAVQPDLSVNEDVNTGDRTGVRAARQVRAQRAAHHHPAPRLPEGGDGRLEPHRRLQHPGQPLHHHAAGGDAGRARAVHADRRAVHRRVPARRPEPQLRLRRASR